MGVVPKQMESSFSYHGDVFRTVAVYIYCDNCGSFDIDKHLSIRQWLLIISSCLLVAVLISLKYAPISFITIPYTLAKAYWFLLLFVIPFIGMLVFNFWGFPAYKCRKCGEFTTIRYNTRDYPSDIEINVPEQLIQKFGLKGWPEDQPLEAYLCPPEKQKEKE